MDLLLPYPAFILLVGASGSGKSTFARRHFSSTEIVSSDYCRALICDKESNQDATPDAFDLLRFIVRKRLKRKRLTVVDATNVQSQSRRRLLSLAFQFDVPMFVIVFAVGEHVCQQRNGSRTERIVRAEVIREQCADLQIALSELEQEGYAGVYSASDVEMIIRLDSSGLPL